MLKSFLSQKYFFCYLSVVLSGCSFAPKYERPPLPTAETYPRNGCEENGVNVRQLDWQDFFADPILQELIELALENNRDLRAAMARMSEAWSGYGHKWADLFPTLNGSAADLRMRVPGNILPNTPPFIFSAYLAAVSVVSWEVDFWGRLRNLKDAALQNYFASAESEHAAFISLIGQVANTYLTERELNEQVHIALKTVESRQESFRIMTRRFEEGTSSKFEAIQAETLLQQAKSDLTVLERKREVNWNLMTLLVGTPICPDDCELSEIEPYFITELCAGLPSELLCNRPDVLAAEHKLKAANANIGAAKAAFFPTISLTGAYGSASNELKNLFGGGNSFWAYAPTLSVPIFDWGRNCSDLSLAKARRNLAVAEYEHTIQVAFREVADALAERAWLGEQVDAQTKLLEAQKERARLAWIRFQYGSSPYFEVLDAERDKFSAEQELVETKRALLTSGVNLYTALGGGFCR